MTNILLKYLEDRYKYHIPKEEDVSKGPVITISREFGLSANLIASDLAEVLSKMEPDKEPWRVISKEILDKASNELGLSPEKIEFVFKFEKRSVVDEILEALSSKYYKSERKIRNTIREIIEAIGKKGRAIIVGRAGSAILKDIPDSLHVKLIAPIDFRVGGVSRRREIDLCEARKLTDEMDKNRMQLKRDFAGRDISDTDYDLLINCESFNKQKVVEIIVNSAQSKGIL